MMESKLGCPTQKPLDVLLKLEAMENVQAQLGEIITSLYTRLNFVSRSEPSNKRIAPEEQSAICPLSSKIQDLMLKERENSARLMDIIDRLEI